MTQVSVATLRQQFILSDPTSGHNKVWQIEWDEKTGMATVAWGKVGAQLQTQTRNMSFGEVQGKINEKTGKGYREVQLHHPATVEAMAVPTVGISSSVTELMKFIAMEAGRQINTYSAVPIFELSKDQIVLGRDAITRAHNQGGPRHIDKIQDYLNIIPTKLPWSRRIDDSDLVAWFASKEPELYAQLDQLEANLTVYQSTKAGNTSLFAGLPVEIEEFSSQDEDYEPLMRLVQWGRRSNIRAYRLKIIPERQAWEQETVGKSNMMTLFHGTRSYNLQKILYGGLKIMPVAANGSRFGRGLYFADNVRRSYNYAESQYRKWRCIFVNDVALGKTFKTPRDLPSHASTAPTGYDSVHGTNSNSGMDEFVVYRESQKTTRALLVYEE